jgi:hypothetical protein
MSFETLINNSILKYPRVLLEMDISVRNDQWINYGAGVWKVNMDNSYPEVDPTLLIPFFALNYETIGSVKVDSFNLVKVDSALEVVNESNSFYFDRTSKDLFIKIYNYDKPSLHLIKIGVMYGFSYNEFIPQNSLDTYEGRVKNDITISMSRDPLYYGKMVYDFSSYNLINSDAEYDSFGEDNNVYGNEIRILYGFEELDYEDYHLLYSAYLEKIKVSESELAVTLSDKRKQLSAEVQYQCTDKNALEAIEELLYTVYSIPYNSNYYNIIQWEAAKALVPNITIDLVTADEEMAVNNIIQDICSSVFGLFRIDPDNKYTFKLLNDAVIVDTIESYDIMNNPIIEYDPTEIITSTKIGYNKDWNPGYTSPYTFLVDTSKEQEIFDKYQTYKQKTFFTLLTNLIDAQSFSDYILNYFDTVRGTTNIIVPIKYYSIEVADFVNCNIRRRNGEWMGLRKCEILGKSYNLKNNTINFKLRIGDLV